ncbi:hypothetical protein SEA_OBLADI_105 [Gordonia phage ObLaDi]|uniref:Uncharacterized protein n=3 Tax=Cafassovirus TaxID=3425056 RepID=A0A9E7TYE2_9CAUD|nr:hypothetical protein SEA_CAFASSO_106 [Gordonia phage Cafasso]UVK59844.1 hypothetical protein SEA_ALEEMILY_104 [Gordonia phage Aleemily]UXE03828.1 hypothetical protein SEA_OBLADI_105 [Gordonia phage ObLaDi]
MYLLDAATGEINTHGSLGLAVGEVYLEQGHGPQVGISKAAYLALTADAVSLAIARDRIADLEKALREVGQHAALSVGRIEEVLTA